MIDFSKRLTKNKLQDFANLLKGLSDQIGFKVSSRGWCYLMEQAGHIDKSQFNKIEDAINKCRRKGILPVDFVAEEDARAFQGVEEPTLGPLEETLEWMLRDVLTGHKYYIPDWWADEEYYIQVVVEKIDLKTLFGPICKEYHIPIANAKGWSSILQRAEYSRRFKEAEEMGLKCVLLYCGDHDPDGLRISDTLRSNLEQVNMVEWSDGFTGYDPEDLIIHRMGLNYDFIKQQGYTWIDNLITGSGKNLASKGHPNHNLEYLQDYLKEFGERKCEANAIVTTPDVARQLMRNEIEQFLGPEAKDRFRIKTNQIKTEYEGLLDGHGLLPIINNILRK